MFPGVLPIILFASSPTAKTSLLRYPSSWAALTVDLNEVCEKDCSYVDTNHHGRKILSWIIENGLGELTGQRNRSGYCTYEKIRFYPEKLKDCDPEGYQRYKIKFEET